MQANTIQYNTRQCMPIQDNIRLDKTMQDPTKQGISIHDKPHNNTQNKKVHDKTRQYNIIHYDATQHKTRQHNTR